MEDDDSEILPPLCDSNGRAYARLDELTSGSKITLDADFTCREAGPAIVHSTEAHNSSESLYFHCSCQGYRHYLIGQVDNSGDGEQWLLGIYHYDKDLDGPTPKSWPKEEGTPSPV